MYIQFRLISSFKVFGCCVFFSLLSACSSSPHKVNRQALPELVLLGQVGADEVGLNDRDEVILRTKKNAIAEMAGLRYLLSESTRRIEIAKGELQRCRNESADPRLGNQKIPDDLPEAPTSSSRSQPELWTLTSDNELLLVSESYLKDEVQRLQRDKNVFEGFLHSLDKMLSRCMDEYGHLRVKKGLPYNRIRAKGHFVNGNWKLLRDGEQSLDDAFRLVAEERSFKKQNQELSFDSQGE